MRQSSGDTEVFDPSGFPIEMDRPVVFEEGDFENPHTELSITESAEDLGLPGTGFYNVPSIYGGKIYDPKTQFDIIRQNAQQQAASGFRFPNFPSIEEAEKAAQARSAYFNQIKADMLRQAVEKRRQELILQMMGGGR
jgi:hypothetical protein